MLLPDVNIGDVHRWKHVKNVKEVDGKPKPDWEAPTFVPRRIANYLAHTSTITTARLNELNTIGDLGFTALAIASTEAATALAPPTVWVA